VSSSSTVMVTITDAETPLTEVGEQLLRRLHRCWIQAGEEITSKTALNRRTLSPQTSDTVPLPCPGNAMKRAARSWGQGWPQATRRAWP
jgi:hypothetical protein